MLGEIKVQETGTTDCVHVGRLPNYSPSAPCAHLDVYFWSDDAGPAHDDADAVAAGGGGASLFGGGSGGGSGFRAGKSVWEGFKITGIFENLTDFCGICAIITSNLPVFTAK